MPLIQEDAPHPHSYRPDLPLRGDTYATGAQRSHEQVAIDRSAWATVDHLRSQLHKSEQKVAALSDQVSALTPSGEARA